MRHSFISRIADFCRKNALFVALAAFACCSAMGYYVAGNIKINTDINQLLSPDLEWRKQERELENAFPHKTDRLVVVVDGENPDLAEDAAEKLAEKMRALPEIYKNVTRPEAIPFFKKNGFLFLSEAELNGLLENLIRAQPVLGMLSQDPSLRGLFGATRLVVEGLKSGEVETSQLEKPFALLSETVETSLSGKAKLFPWMGIMSQEKPALRDLRKFILAQPTLDYASLSPGKQASDGIRAMAKDMGLAPENGVTVRLTGSVALNDEEFASVADGAEMATLVSAVLVLLLLFLALGSWRLIAPIMLTLVAGLVATTAFALAAVGSLNLISVAFAVMFVGMAVDFGIQFGVKFREMKYAEENTAKAMSMAASSIARPLSLAAMSTILGFAAFIPTNYRGVSELGIIAGAGMAIAYALNLTLLPALLTLFKPPAEKEPIGYKWAAPIDTLLVNKRKPILLITYAAVIISLFVAIQIRFDFDPLNLKDRNSESVSTMFDIMEDPQATPYTIEILKPSLEEAVEAAERISSLPEVSHAMTLASFVPEGQDKKLSMISDANFLLSPTLNPAEILSPPSDEETYKALRNAAEQLRKIVGSPSAARLAKAIEAVADANNPEILQSLHSALISGMEKRVIAVREALSAERVAPEKITEDLRRDWMTADGRAKIEVYPKENARDPRGLKAFTKAVSLIEPNASGTPVSILESGKTVSGAFAEAGLLALLLIAVFFLFILKSVADVLRLLTPLIIAGIFTLATMVIIDLPLNYANIIALPLLLSLGVSYSIYFLNYWRNGMTNPLQSSMARAVLFSAATTLVAFGSLSMSSHPGTSGMGELLTIALIYSLVCTFLVFPVLLGKQK